MVLLASLVFYAGRAVGVQPRPPGAEEVDRKDLVNPAQEGDEVLANLPEINSPLVASYPRIVGSQNMTPEAFVQTFGGDINAK